MKKNPFQALFKAFAVNKKRADPTPKKHPGTTDDTELPLNKFGQPESLIDQCEHHTCTCDPTECKIDDLMCYESVLLIDYVRRLKNAKGELE